jgi:hypothetical protein
LSPKCPPAWASAVTARLDYFRFARNSPTNMVESGKTPNRYIDLSSEEIPFT